MTDQETRAKLYGTALASSMKHLEEQGYRISYHGTGFAVKNEKAICFLEFQSFRVKITSYLKQAANDLNDKIDEFNVMDLDNLGLHIFVTVNEHLTHWQQKGGDTA